MSEVADAAVFVAASACITVLLMLAGYAPARLVLPSTSFGVVGLSGAAGVGLLAFVTGITAVYIDGPLGIIVPCEAAALAIIGIVVLVVDIRRRSLPPLPDLVLVGCVALAALAVTAWNVRFVFGYGPLATASWNNDILSYAMNARLLQELGLGAHGWIIGFDGGAAARADVLGAYTALLPFGVLFGDPLRAAMPLMGALTAVIVTASFVVLRRLLGVGRVVAVIGSFVFIVGYPGTYNGYQYFLSERLAVATMLAALALSSASRDWRRLLLVQAIATAVLALAYPQALPVEAVMVALGAIGGLGLSRPTLARYRLLRLASVVVGTCLGAAFLGLYMVERIDRARALLSVAAGWSMPTLSLAEMVGAVDVVPFLPPASALVVELGAMLAVLALLIGFRERPIRAAATAIVVLLVPTALYVRFAFSEPDSYRQWKAMALAAPFAVLAVVGLLVLLCEVLQVDRWRIRALAPVPVVAVGALLLMANHGGYQPTDDPYRCMSTGCPIGTEVRDQLTGFAATAGPGPVAVALGPYWPSMSAAYFLWGRPIAMRDPNYWSVSDAPVTQTLGPNGWYSSR